MGTSEHVGLTAGRDASGLDSWTARFATAVRYVVHCSTNCNYAHLPCSWFGVSPGMPRLPLPFPLPGYCLAAKRRGSEAACISGMALALPWHCPGLGPRPAGWLSRSLCLCRTRLPALAASAVDCGTTQPSSGTPRTRPRLGE